MFHAQRLQKSLSVYNCYSKSKPRNSGGLTVNGSTKFLSGFTSRIILEKCWFQVQRQTPLARKPVESSCVKLCVAGQFLQPSWQRRSAQKSQCKLRCSECFARVGGVPLVWLNIKGSTRTDITNCLLGGIYFPFRTGHCAPQDRGNQDLHIASGDLHMECDADESIVVVPMGNVHTFGIAVLGATSLYQLLCVTRGVLQQRSSHSQL